MMNRHVSPQSTTSPSYSTSAAVVKDMFSCIDFCDNNGTCTLTGPKITAVCSCNSTFKGTFCEEAILWFEFLVRDGRLTGKGCIALLCVGISLAVAVFAGVIFYRRYRVKKSKTRDKIFSHTDDRIFEELHVSSQDQLLVYQVAQPISASSSPAPTPCSPQGQGICYLMPTSPEATTEANNWQDYHNPGYRQSYIDSGI